MYRPCYDTLKYDVSHEETTGDGKLFQDDNSGLRQTCKIECSRRLHGSKKSSWLNLREWRECALTPHKRKSVRLDTPYNNSRYSDIYAAYIIQVPVFSGVSLFVFLVFRLVTTLTPL